jgi:hypothetical protein
MHFAKQRAVGGRVRLSMAGVKGRLLILQTLFYLYIYYLYCCFICLSNTISKVSNNDGHPLGIILESIEADP